MNVFATTRGSESEVKSSCCVRSRTAPIVLIWSLVVHISYNFMLNPEVMRRYQNIPKTAVFGLNLYLLLGRVMLIFYPLFGSCGDIRCGRFRLIRGSLCLLLPLLVIEAILLTRITFLTFHSGNSSLNPLIASIYLTGLLMLHITVEVFTANIIQFGLDQLQDLPTGDSSLFIHWYMCVYYISWFLSELIWCVDQGIILAVCYSFLSLPVVAVTLYISFRRERWFFTDYDLKVDPFSLVYRVTKFAFRHKVPVRRSAFTYCEDEPPSRLDLGKGKFGGPFTTEQVEDVKVFYGILKVLLSLGPVFFLEMPANVLIAYHFWEFELDLAGYTLVSAYGLSLPVVASASLLLHVCVLRRFLAHLIPSMLKRMGLGFFIALLALFYTVALYSVRDYSMKQNITTVIRVDERCFEDRYYFHNESTAFQFFPKVEYFIPQNILLGISQMLFYIAMYEFICAQSPHHMKGLLIGLSFAIKGLFQVVSLAMFLITQNLLSWKQFFPSCELVYYFVFLAAGSVAFLVFICVARRYQYRMRDEPCRVRQYAEDYYSNIQ